MKVEKVGAFAATVASLSTLTYGYSFSDVSTAETERESTGLTTNEENRIWGGTDANIDKYPFLASLRDSFFEENFCAGTLIAPQYILTAGHCIRTDEMDIIATFGTNDSAGSGSGAAISVPVIEGFRHPLYKKKEHLYDVGLLKLKKPIKRKMAKLCAVDGSDNKVGTMGTVLGWGKTETSGELGSPVLQQLTLPVISNAECGKFKKYVGRVTEGMMCAGTGNDKDTCNGDSGGPLLVDGNILIGCVSWGSKCGEQAGIFTRLSYVMDYIEDILAGGDGSKFGVASSSGSLMEQQTSAKKGKITKAPASEDDSTSGSDDLASLFNGSGSDDLSWLLKLLKSNSGSGSNDLSWLFDSNSDSGSASGSEDTVLIKGGKATKAPVKDSSESASEETDVPATKGKATKTPNDEDDSESGSDDLSWLLDSDLDSGSEDPTLVKGATKGKPTTAASGNHDLDWLFASESDSGSEDTVLVKGGKTTKATKASKASKTLIEDSASTSDSTSASEDSAYQSDSVHQSDQELRLADMGQAGSVQQKSALRDVLALRRPNVSNTELEEVLRTFCALFPLELQVPVDADPNLLSNIVGVDVKERRLFDVVHGLLQDQTEQAQRNNARDMTGLILTSFRRVIRWRELYKLCAKCSMKPFLACLSRPSPTLVLSVLETLQLMLSPCPGFETGDKAADRSEAANRRNFGDAGGFEVLRSLLVQYGAAVVKENQKEDAAKVLEGVLKLFHLVLVKRRVATDMMACSQAVGALMNARVSLLDLCHCRVGDCAVMRLASALVKELFCIVDLDQVHELQESAREYGALLYALETAVQETIESGKNVEDTDELELEMRELCVDLVEVFCAGNTRSKKTMYRIFPVDLFIPARSRVELIPRHTGASPSSMVRAKPPIAARSARNLPHFSFEFEQPRRTSIATSNVAATNANAENKRNRVVALAYNAMNFGGGAFERWIGDAREKGEHWRDIIEAVRQTHERPELVWRAPMRAELRQALQAEIETLERRRRCIAEDDSAQSGEQIPRWDHEMFYVEYPSMHDELVVNDYFVEYLIPRVADLSATYEIAEPVVLAWHLSDRLPVEHDEKWAQLCVRCLRLVIRRYAMLFHGQLPTQYVLLLLRDHMNHSPAFVRECFLLLNTAIITTRSTPSESFNQLCTSVTRTIVGVLADPVLLATFSGPLESEDEADQDSILHIAEPEDEAVSVVNERDALIRAGVSLLLTIARRGKFILRLVRPKRMYLCRLLAVETLDHVTITRLLFVLKQLALLDGNSDYNSSSGGVSSRLSSASSPSLQSSSTSSHSSSTTDSNWRSLTLVYVLLASCDPKGMGMCVAAAEFLKECCVLPPASRGAGGTKNTYPPNELTDLLNDALGFGGCGMERLLNSASAEVFADTFNASQKRAADVNWGRKQRVRLYRYLKHKYLGSESKTSWNNFVDGDTDHRYEDDDLFIGNIFLRSYIEGGGEFLSEWTPEMFNELINALFEELVQLGRRKSAYTTGTGNIGPLPSPSRQPSLIQSSSSGGPCAAESWEVQVLILKALARLIPSHGAEVKIKSEFYEALLAPLRRSMLSEVDQVRGILSLDLFAAVISVPETHSVNTAACRLFLEEKGLSVIADALERMRTPAFQQILQTVEVFGPRRRSNSSNQNMARVLLYRLTDVLSIVASQQAPGIRAITKNPDVVTALIELASRQIITQYADIDAASVCLSCLGGLCHYDELRTLVINAGGLLSLLDTVAFCPAEELDKTATRESQGTDERSESDSSDTEDGQEEAAKVELPNGDTEISSEDNDKDTSGKETEGGEDIQRIPSRFFGAIRSAALVLRACLGPKNAPVPSLPTQVLYQLLTPSFVRVLRTSPDQFILELQTTEDISTATLIWTVSMRQRLQTCIATELAKVKAAATAKTWPRWNPEHFVAADSFRYQYPELADVLVLHDVYLANFVATPVEDLDLGDIDMAAFSEALLISIQSHENVLRILQERGSSDPTKETAIRLMRQALDKLVSKHPQHNLEVDASRDVPLSDGSPPVSPTSTPAFFSPQTLAAAEHSFAPTDDRDWDITRIERCSSSGIEDLTV
ncbi:hypothetical protein Pcac1_g20326 [Phytophthora cactorum]|nr:hypothetical protein Pcac1_g20326 [Phytophthora cactorum]